MSSPRVWTSCGIPLPARPRLPRRSRAKRSAVRDGPNFRGAVVASVITSLLVGGPLALVANQLSEHANADQVRAAQFQAQAQNISRRRSRVRLPWRLLPRKSRRPSCLAQPTQCQGAKGDQGLPGEPPVSWTVEESDGSSTTCGRVAGFDPAAPRYRCSHAAPPSAAVTTPSPRSGAGPSPRPAG